MSPEGRCRCGGTTTEGDGWWTHVHAPGHVERPHLRLVQSCESAPERGSAEGVFLVLIGIAIVAEAIGRAFR